MHRTVYFGASSDAKRLQTLAGEEELLYFVDNDSARHGSRFLGRDVRPVSALRSGDFDRVRIVCGATWDAVRQLRELGVPEGKIVADVLEPRNVEFLRSLAGRHQGRRAFVIGNGPSLRMSDLENIHASGDVAFAFNKIYLAFGETRFRPTYYMVDDLLVARNNAERISALSGFPKLFPDAALRYITKDADTYVFGMTFQHGTAPVSQISESPLHLYSGATVTYSALQMALLMGCDPIYLIGVDFSFIEPPDDRTDGNMFVHLDERNHFHPDYRTKGERWFRPDQAFAVKSFLAAKRLAARRGTRILNATRGGKLDVFERTSLDALFQVLEFR